MDEYDIGKYTYHVSQNRDFYFTTSSGSADRLDMDVRVKSYDLMLHQLLDKIFREHFLCSSEKLKEYLRGPRLKSIIKPILDQEPFLSRYFSKKELEELSLLWIAVLGCYEKSAELLVRSGADVNELFGPHDPQMIDEKWTILHVLIQMDPTPENEHLIRLVMDQGADLQARDCQGETVLHIAVREDRVKVVEMLLEKGADVNVADNEGETPLITAVSYKAIELLPLLIKHGADVFAKNRVGQNALHCLVWTIGNDASNHAVDIARVLIKEGVSVTDKEIRKHYQPIHLAAMHKHNELVEIFLDHGADVNALTEDKESPLILAAEGDATTVAKTLLKRGANIHLRTIGRFAGRTALHAACMASGRRARDFEDNQRESTIGQLLFAGADVLAEDRRGKTPFAFFRTNGNVRQLDSRLMIRALALKKALQPSITLKDKEIIDRYPDLLNYYRKCTEEIDKMKCTSFIETCTFFQLITKSRCQIAALMQNPEFETMFRLYDLNEFPIYSEDILRAFERAEEHHHSLLEQKDVIDEAVYNVLPYLVVKKAVRYIFNDCCSKYVK